MLYVTPRVLKGNLKCSVDNNLLADLTLEEIHSIMINYFALKDNDGNYILDENGEMIILDPYTGIQIQQSDLILEHIIPRAYGGTTLFNILPSIKTVNSSKSNKNLIQWWKKSFWDLNRFIKVVDYIFDMYEYKFINPNKFTLKKIDIEESSNNIYNKAIDYVITSNDDLDENIADEGVRYYNFLLQCISELRENNINVEKYEKILSQLVAKNVFTNIDLYENYMSITKKVFEQYTDRDLSSILLKINISQLLSSMNFNNIDEFKIKLNQKISSINQKLIKVGYTFDDLLYNVDNVSFIFYQSGDEIDEKTIYDAISKMKISIEQKIEIIINYFDNNGEWPKNNSFDEKGNNLGYFCSVIRHDINVGDYIPNEETLNKIMTRDPLFFSSRNELKEKQFINKLLVFYEKNKRWPRNIWHPKNLQEENEKLLGLKMNLFRSRNRFFNSTIDDEDKNKLLTIDPNFFNNKVEIVRNDNVERLIDFYKTNGRWPDAYNKPIEEVKLARIKYKIQSLNRNKNFNITEEQRQDLVALDFNFFNYQIDKKQDDRNNRLVNMLTFYDNNNKWPQFFSDPKNKQEKEENELARRSVALFRNNINLLTEEQKSEILSRDPLFFMNQRDRGMYERFFKILNFFDTFGLWPTNTLNEDMYINYGFGVDEIEKLGQMIYDIRSGKKYKKLNFDEILKRDPLFFQNQKDKTKNEKFAQLITFFSRNNRWPKQAEGSVGRFFNNLTQGGIYISSEQYQILIDFDSSLVLKKIKIKENEVNNWRGK